MTKSTAKPAREIQTPNPLSAIKAVQESHEELLKTAGPDMVYGRPIKSGDTIIIPTSEVLVFSGFGYGSGYGQGFEGEGAEPSEGGGGGGGGGGKTLSRPVAVVIVSPEGVRVEPIYDVTKVYMAAITAAGFTLAMLVKFMRPTRLFKK